MIKLVFLLFITISTTLAKVEVEKISISCSNSFFCENYSNSLKNLERSYRDLNHFETTLKIHLSRGGASNIYYEIKKKEGKYYLSIHLEPKKVVSKIDFKVTPRKSFDFLSSISGLSTGDYVDDTTLNEAANKLYNYFVDQGYPDNQVRIKQKDNNGKVEVVFDIILKEPLILKTLTIETIHPFVYDFLINGFNDLLKKPLNNRQLSEKLESLKNELFNYGFYLIKVEPTTIINNKQALLKLDVRESTQYTYSFNGKNLRFNKKEYLESIKKEYRKVGKSLEIDNIVNAIKGLYVSNGYLNTVIDIKRSSYVDKFNEKVAKTTIDIKEGGITRIREIITRGNIHLSNKELEDLYYEDALELASLDIYDQKYLGDYVLKMKKKYFTMGFVQVDISKPIIKPSSPGFVDVEYQIRENVRTYIEQIDILGIGENETSLIFNKLKNKLGEHFNPIVFDDDLKTIINYFQEKGFFNAKIININSQDIVQYQKNKRTVRLNIKVELGKKLVRDELIIIGNERTKRRFITKRISIKKGDTITPKKVRRIENALSSSGLFSLVNVRPLIIDEATGSSDLIVSLVEKDSVVVEVAPGYRTDLGVKLSTEVKFSNLTGMNRSITLKGQVNQRLNFSSLAPERRDDDDFLEYNAQINYGVPQLYGTQFNFSSIFAITKRRFYSFDANIVRGNASINRDWNKYFTTNLRYQLEEIRQSNAVESDDNGRFQIGSLSPSVAFDFRDNRLNPRKGAYFNLSWELANPNFGSQQNSTQTIDYQKFISRNRFYLPFPKGVFAIYTAMGVQKNYSDNSGIPSIKLFRLTGVDIIRGYDDEEMNIAEQTADISEFEVTDKVYMSLYKIEPRFYISDKFIMGFFMDGGQLFVDSFRPLDVRSSVGVSFKYLTPVGSLDFDYGHKLSRGNLPDGTKESPGRVHISIGFF